MIKVNKLTREAISQLDGLHPVIENGARHLKLKWINPHGRKRMIILSRGRGTQDPRGSRNNRAIIKRLNGATP